MGALTRLRPRPDSKASLILNYSTEAPPLAGDLPYSRQTTLPDAQATPRKSGSYVFQFTHRLISTDSKRMARIRFGLLPFTSRSSISKFIEPVLPTPAGNAHKSPPDSGEFWERPGRRNVEMNRTRDTLETMSYAYSITNRARAVAMDRLKPTRSSLVYISHLLHPRPAAADLCRIKTNAWFVRKRNQYCSGVRSPIVGGRFCS